MEMDIFTFSCAYATSVYVHRAVAMAFIEGDGSQQVNHIDANKAHNDFECVEEFQSQMGLPSKNSTNKVARGKRTERLFKLKTER